MNLKIEILKEEWALPSIAKKKTHKESLGW